MQKKNVYRDQSRVLLHRSAGVVIIDILQARAHALLPRSRVHGVDRDLRPKHTHVLDRHDALAHVLVHVHVASHRRKRLAVLHTHTVAVVVRCVVAKHRVVVARDVVLRAVHRLQVGILMVLSKL